MTKIGKGFDLKTSGYGLMFIGLGVFLLYGVIFDNNIFSYHGFILPQWTSYVTGGVAIAAGVWMVSKSINNKKCLDCREIFEDMQVVLAFDQKKRVVEAVNTLNVDLIKHVPLANEKENCIILSLSYCPECAKVAEVQVTAKEDSVVTELIPLKEISGDSVKAFVQYVES